MTNDAVLNIIIWAAIGLLFIGTIITLMIKNPNYSFKEILKKPWLIFHIVSEAKDIIDTSLDTIKAEAQESINDVNEIKQIITDATESVESLADTIKDSAEDIKNVLKP